MQGLHLCEAGRAGTGRALLAQIVRAAPRGQRVLHIRCENRGRAGAPTCRVDGRPLRPATPKPKLSDYPSGAALWYMDGDISLSADFGAKGRSIRFYWNVNKVPNAKGVAWQVSSAPFANFEASDSDLHPSSIVASANVFEAQGSFVVDFAKLSETGRPSREAASHEPNWHVRILPLGDPQTIVGSPSNVIGVYAEEAPSSGPGFKLPTQQWYMKPGLHKPFEREPNSF
jgi:hypothetical protein